MAMYRDSQLGLCIDIRGPDGNIFVLWGYAQDLARQLGKSKEWHDTLEAGKKLAGKYGNYGYMLNIFREFFPMVTLIGYDEVMEKHNAPNKEQETQKAT